MLAKLGVSMHGSFCFGQTTALPSTVPKNFPWPIKLKKDVPGRRWFWENNS